MTPAHPFEVAGVTLAAPLLRYDVEDLLWGSASLVRPHLARALQGATLTVRPPDGAPDASFLLEPFFLLPAVQPYMSPPAIAWRALVVDQGLLARPELIWTGTVPEGWDQDVAEALTALHRRYRGLTDERMLDWMLRTLECNECRTDRESKVPTGLPPWMAHMRRQPSGRCAHVPAALHALGALCKLHPELTFELLGWIEPAGARAENEGPPVTRFALTGPVMEAMLGPWLLGEERRLAGRSIFRGYVWPFHTRAAWGAPSRPLLPRWERGGVMLAASAWEIEGEPEALVQGDPSAALPGLDPAAAPPIEAEAALPGEKVRRKSGRGRRRP